MSKHTPGPWEAQPPLNPNDDYADISGPEHIGLAAVVWNIDGKPDEVCQANAHLIRAAPELLEQVVEVYNSIEFGGRIVSFSDEDIELMGELIEKARGEE